MLPAIAVNGTNVYVVWDDDTLDPAGFPDIFYRRSTDGGATFEPKVNLSANPGISGGPSVVANGSNVYVIWGDATIVGGQVFSDILYVRSSDGGAMFEPVQNLSSSPTTYSSNHWIATDGNYVHVVWSESSDEIFYRRSIDSGATFNPTLNLSSTPGAGSLSPSVVLSGSNVYVAWIDGYSGEQEIFFTHSSNNGITFAPAKNLSANVGDDYWYRIAASDQNVYMVWWHNPVYNPYETFYIRSTDGGNTFEPKRILSSSKRSGDPRLAVDGYKVHAAWTESDDFSSDDLFYRRSVNNGATFDSPVNLSASGAVMGVFDVVASDGNVYVLWEDHSPGNADIFFRRLSEETIPEGITIYTNQTSYKEGDTLTLSCSISNSGDSFKADVFLGFVLPDESIWFFDKSLQNLKTCDPNDRRTFTAAITSLDIPKGYRFPKTSFFSVTLPALPQGTYMAFAALAEPGSSKTGNLALIGDVSLAFFTFTGVESQIDFRFPLDGDWSPKTQEFGAWYQDYCGYHLAEDIAHAAGTAVYPMADGTVKFAQVVVGKPSGLGYAIHIEHELLSGSPDENKVVSVYYHLKRPEDGGITWKLNQKVDKDNPIGYVSGKSEDFGEGPQLHFGIRRGEYKAGCDPRTKKWYYPGYTAIYKYDGACAPSGEGERQCNKDDSVHQDILSKWESPEEFIRRHMD